ncbi:NAD(P)H-dependent oxidoreductase [Streptomyces canus]|uniref:NAD(P)H-dependent oxidoreductase n=1 Tax=Streptomyces canus TaxID=58343 RepID=UPI002782A924|nr:NAD(P)H-dependent oxidoreductase [Streptomyces canus]MDQ0765459.1 FMN-dependent NADH-azoreductase [Streptomyces canus]
MREYLLDPSRDHGQTDDELDAGTIVLGVPMYNYTIPSSVKAWVDLLVSHGSCSS